MDIRKKYSLCGCLLGLLTLAALVWAWWVQHDYGLWGRAAAVLSAALFALLGLRFVPRWVDFWSDGPLPEAPTDEESPLTGLWIFLALLVLDLLVLAAAWGLRAALGRSGSFADSLGFWTGTDSQHYLAIAEDWYLSEGELARLVQLVFLPGYPVLVRLLQHLTGNYLTAGLLLSALCFAAAGVVFYRLLRLDLPHKTALRGVLFLCLLPGSFFYASPMSESLFLLCSVACVYLARRDRWLLAGLCGAWGAFTRSLGLMLVAPLVMELVADCRRKKPTERRLAPRVLSIALIPLGFAAYCVVNYLVAGNPFQFMIYQSEHWSQHLGLFFNTAAYQTERALSSLADKPHNFLGLWLPNLIYGFGALALVAAAAKKLRASYTAWFIAYFVVAIGATWLLSAPRYLMAMPVLPMTLALLTEKENAKTAAIVPLTLLWLLYFLAFLQRWQVW
ncbi:MAG: glycosyltransferase family 39 protein [Oscillospiraceae bacterium]|nr:glycosyltransferase family 39 protein [Oscillospiraceae bacterium]